MTITETKICTDCGGDLPVSLFLLSRRRKDGSRSYWGQCLGCRPLSSRTCSKCEKKHFGKGLCLQHYAATYRASNRRLLSKKSIAYQAEHKAIVNAKNSAWRKRNPEKSNVVTTARRARQRGAEGTHTAQEVLTLFALQKGCCAVCRDQLPKSYHKDHIQPLKAGGSNWIRNIQLLCGSCNTTKQAKDPVAFMQSRGYLL